MAIISIFQIFLLITFLVGIGSGEESTTSTFTATTTAPELLDATVGGKSGNPGAQLRFSAKALDVIYAHAMEKISQAIRSMTIPDVIVPIGGGMLTIKATRVTEATLGKFDRQMLPPNRLRSHFTEGRLVSVGQWSYKPMGVTRSIAQGLFRTVITNAELTTTNQFGRTWDEKPSITTTECKAYLGEFRVEIEGFGENTTVIDECDNLLCSRIRAYFEDSVCNTARNYIKEAINQKLATFPTKINLGSTGNRYVLNYGLLTGEPKVNEQFIQASLDGEVMARGTNAAPFYAPELQMTNSTSRMVSMPFSDFGFNSLFHHAHQQHRFSAIEMLYSNSTLLNLLKFDCSGPSSNPVEQRRLKTHNRIYGQSRSMPSCLGSVFANSTQKFPKDATGDLVFKSQRPLQVMIRRSPQKHWFGQSARYASVGGSIEVYGPIATDGKRNLLATANIQKLSGEFSPKMSGCNATGSIVISELELIQSGPQSRVRSLADPVLSQLSQISMPVFEEMFNNFLREFAQFPMPMLDGYECVEPELIFHDRAIQMDADVRVLEHATRKIKG